jgi:hypothetical protein
VAGFAYLVPKPVALDQGYAATYGVVVSDITAVGFWADLPCKLLMLIAPLATPASVRTAASFSEINAVELYPNSVLTCDMDIVPVGSVMVLPYGVP